MLGRQRPRFNFWLGFAIIMIFLWRIACDIRNTRCMFGYPSRLLWNCMGIYALESFGCWRVTASVIIDVQYDLMYKMNNKLVDVPTDKYLIPAQTSTRNSHAFRYQSYQPRIDVFKNLYLPRTIIEWYFLPPRTVGVSSLDSFKVDRSAKQKKARSFSMI